jgi:tripartite-type tricarboxylate transporter receptor subunit TctC
MPDVQKRLDDLGFEVVANSPDEFAARIKTELGWWAKVIRDTKIKPDGTQ